jgi:hypothetical protein
MKNKLMVAAAIMIAAVGLVGCATSAPKHAGKSCDGACCKQGAEACARCCGTDCAACCKK